MNKRKIIENLKSLDDDIAVELIYNEEKIIGQLIDKYLYISLAVILISIMLFLSKKLCKAKPRIIVKSETVPLTLINANT